MRTALAGSLLVVLAVGTAAQAPATSVERPFAAGGRVTMDLSAGEYEITGSPDNRVRLDWLFSYQPTPGTVVFAGYGTGLEVPDLRDELRRQYRRTTDGFFAKISYLFRL